MRACRWSRATPRSSRREAATSSSSTPPASGWCPEGLELSADQARPGDKILLSGYIGDHGIAILAQREGLEFESPIQSDSAALHGLVAEMLEASSGMAGAIRCMRDPTRGGLSSALNEIAEQSKAGIQIEEPAIPIREEVRGACEMLGLDPLYVANEGKLIAIVDPGSGRADLGGHAAPSAGQGIATHRYGHRALARNGHHAHRAGHDAHCRHAGGRPIAADLLRP